MRTTKGFTLLELLIVVAVIGILAAISIPFYNDYVTRSKITEAISALSDGRIKMEQFFQDNRTYAGGPAPAATTYFTYSTAIPAIPTATTYTITATGITSMAGFTYSINETNTRSTTAAPSGWATPTMPASCWIVRKRSC